MYCASVVQPDFQHLLALSCPVAPLAMQRRTLLLGIALVNGADKLRDRIRLRETASA